MFQVIKLNDGTKVEYYKDSRPFVRGFGTVIKSILGLNHVLHWKQMKRNEGFELMKKYPPFMKFFTPPRLILEKRKELRDGEIVHPYYYVDETIFVPAGPWPTCPIHLWMPLDTDAWVRQRVDIIVDHWKGAETATSAEEWVITVHQRTKVEKISPSFEWASFDILTARSQGKSIYQDSASRRQYDGSSMAWLRELFEASKEVPDQELPSSYPNVRAKWRSLASQVSLAWRLITKGLTRTTDLFVLNMMNWTSKPKISLSSALWQHERMHHVLNCIMPY